MTDTIFNYLLHFCYKFYSNLIPQDNMEMCLRWDLKYVIF